MGMAKKLKYSKKKKHRGGEVVSRNEEDICYIEEQQPLFGEKFSKKYYEIINKNKDIINGLYPSDLDQNLISDEDIDRELEYVNECYENEKGNIKNLIKDIKNSVTYVNGEAIEFNLNSLAGTLKDKIMEKFGGNANNKDHGKGVVPILLTTDDEINKSNFYFNSKLLLKLNDINVHIPYIYPNMGNLMGSGSHSIFPTFDDPQWENFGAGSGPV